MGFHIELSNPNRSYLSGQAVEGRLIIHNTKVDKVKEVTICLEGKGKIRFAFHLNRFGSEHYKNEENYVFYIKTLVGDGDNLTTLPKGTTSYSFRFVLPANIPSSFKSPNCKIHYKLKATIRRSAGKFHDSIQLPFTVNGVFDLNDKPIASSPQECRKMRGKNFCFRKGQLSFVLILPSRSCFIPGESIYFRLEITNSNNKKVYGVKVSLLQVSKLYAMGIYKTVKTTVSEVRGPMVEEGEHEVWTDKLSIPPVLPTRLGGTSQMIDLEYSLHVEMNMSGLSSPLSGELPILIGNIPLMSTFGHFCAATAPLQTSSLVQVKPIPSTSKQIKLPENAVTVSCAPIFSDYPDIPSPFYKEAIDSEDLHWSLLVESSSDESDNLGIHEDVNSVENSLTRTSNSKHFVPKYITYNKINSE